MRVCLFSFVWIAVIGMLTPSTSADEAAQPLRIGIIGLDTSHAIAFTKSINVEKRYEGCEVVAAYPKGSPDIESSVSRVPKYTEQIKEMGVEIVDSIPKLLERVDAVLLETNDGRPHLEQAIPVFKAGKRVFVDKPVAGSLVDAVALYKASDHFGTPMFTSSSLRYTEGAKRIDEGAIGDVIGCDAYSPCPTEPTHPDLYWYGIHGVETLFTVMGPGCESVVRSSSEITDVVVGTWEDGRIGTFRGRRGPDGKYKGGYGGTAFGTKGVMQIGSFSGYTPLLDEIIKFFQTGEPPVSAEESLRIYAFMQAAQASKEQGGVPIKLAEVMEEAEKAAVTKLKAMGVDLSAKVTLMPVPGEWSKNAFGEPGNEPRVAWYRAYAKVPDKWVDPRGGKLYANSVTLTVEYLADAYEIFVNGEKLAAEGKFPPNFVSAGDEVHRYKIPPGVLQQGQYNTIAIKVFAAEGQGGFKGRAPVLAGYFDEAVMKGEWEFLAGDDSGFAMAALDEKPARSVFEEFSVATSAMDRPEELTPGKFVPAEESLAKMTVDESLEVDLVLSDPLIAQPLNMKFDARGRLWLVEYRQYPYPAGLKMVSRDKYYRAVYDQKPLPPPNHHRGMDRISIHEDIDGDGTFDTHKNFVEGLNITSAMEFGDGGIWVINPPYLLFFPDEDGDDIPDDDPIVHLEGFGMEDTHSITNSLTWGPDGWLYAAHGSTVSSHVIVRHPDVESDETHYIEGAAVWRYEPNSGRFEMFAEGGGNAFGLEFDARGRLFSGHNGGNTRGFHYVQGGHYTKRQTGKYGPRQNPYLFGELPWMKHDPTPRFTHDLVRYESTLLPEKFHGDLLCVDPLHQRVVHADLLPWGSTFQTKDLGHPLQGNDEVFRPVHIEVGPLGAVYVADWCEEFIAHGQHFQGQIDINSGRIYRLRPKGDFSYNVEDMSKLKPSQLVERLSSPNKWVRQTAQRLLAFQDEQVPLPMSNPKQAEQASLEFLWADHQQTESITWDASRIASRDPYVKQWAVRLLGDANELSGLREKLVSVCESEKNPEVRSQLACTARRSDANTALGMIGALCGNDSDLNDPFIPWLVWWALESKMGESLDECMALFDEPEFWERPMVRDFLLEKVMRRLASSGTQAELEACAKLLTQAPDQQAQQILLAGFEKAYEGRSLASIPQTLSEAILATGGGSLTLKIRQRVPEAIEQGVEQVTDAKLPPKERMELIMVLGEIGHEPVVPVLLGILDDSPEVNASPDERELLTTTLSALRNFSSPKITEKLVMSIPHMERSVREVALANLAARAASAEALLEAIDDARIDQRQIPVEVIRQLSVHQAPEVAALVRKLWPELDPVSVRQAQEKIAAVSEVLQAGRGDPYAGKQVFNQSCAKCHQLFGEGGKIGPDLTSYQRNDRERMLMNIIDPDREIREGFESYVAITLDGRVVTGFVLDQGRNSIVLRGADGQNVRIARDDLDSLTRQQNSLMPSGLLDKMDEKQLRDLWAYLRAGQPVN